MVQQSKEERCQRLIQVSFAKILNARQQRGGARLHKNLLVLHVLQKARDEQKTRPFEVDYLENFDYERDIDSDSDSQAMDTASDDEQAPTLFECESTQVQYPSADVIPTTILTDRSCLFDEPNYVVPDSDDAEVPCLQRSSSVIVEHLLPLDERSEEFLELRPARPESPVSDGNSPPPQPDCDSEGEDYVDASYAGVPGLSDSRKRKCFEFCDSCKRSRVEDCIGNTHQITGLISVFRLGFSSFSQSQAADQTSDTEGRFMNSSDYFASSEHLNRSVTWPTYLSEMACRS